MDSEEKGQEGSRISLLERRTATRGEDVSITISVGLATPEANAESNIPQGSASLDPETSDAMQSRTSSSIKEAADPANLELLERRRSLSRSVYSKPRSRFADTVFEDESTSQVQQNAVSPTSRRTISPARTPSSGSPRVGGLIDDEDEDEEIYKKIKLRSGKRRRVKVMRVVEWVVTLCIFSCLVTGFAVEKLRKTMIWGLEFWKWCLLAMVVFSGLFLSNCLLSFVIFFIERSFWLKKNVLFLVWGLKKSVQVFVWISMIVLLWVCLFNHGAEWSKTGSKIVNIVTWTLIAVLVGSFLWLLKTLSLTILTSRLHSNAYYDRIQESIFHQYVLQTLSGPPLLEQAMELGRQFSLHGYERGKRKRSETVIDMSKLHKLKQQKASAWTVKVLVDSITNSFLSILSNTLDESVCYDEDIDKEITNEMEAKAAAYSIFRNVAMPGSKYIDEEDLLRFLMKEEVDLVFPLFEGSETGRIGRKSVTDWVVKVYHQRTVLSHALTDTKAAIKQLNKMMSGIVVIVGIIIWLLLLKVTSPETLALFLTAIGFTFGNTCKSIVEAAIFVFVVHPFDVGDRCVVDGVLLLVEEMDIFTTVFLKLDNEKVYYPNSVLSSKPISNYNRSPDMGDSVEFLIDFGTPMEKIGTMKEKIKRYIEYNPRHWHPNHNILVKETENENKLKVTLNCSHTINFQELGEKNRRRTELIIEMKKIFEELDIRSNYMAQQAPLSRLESNLKAR